MREKRIFVFSLLGTVLLVLLFSLCVRFCPQIVYRYAWSSRLNYQYASLTESESQRRGSFIAGYSDDSGMMAFLEYGQYYDFKNKKTTNSNHYLFLNLNYTGRPILKQESFADVQGVECDVLYRHRGHIILDVNDESCSIPIMETLAIHLESGGVIRLIKKAQ